MEYKLSAYFLFILIIDVSLQSGYGSGYSSSSSSAYSASHSGSAYIAGNVEGSEILEEVAEGLKDVLSAAQSYANAGAYGKGTGHGYGVPSGYGSGHLGNGQAFAGSFSGSYGSGCPSCKDKPSNFGQFSNEEKYTGPFPGPTGSIHDSKPAYAVSGQTGGGSYGGFHVTSETAGVPASSKPTTVIVLETVGTGGSYGGNKFPGPQGNIHDSKPIGTTHPTTSFSPSYKPNYQSNEEVHYSGPFPGPTGSIYDSKPINSESPASTNSIGTSTTTVGINVGKPSCTYGNCNNNQNQGGSLNPNYGKPACSTPGSCSNNPEDGRTPQCTGTGCYGQTGPKTTIQQKPILDLPNFDVLPPKLPTESSCPDCDKVITSYQPPPSGIPPGFPGSSNYVNPPTSYQTTTTQTYPDNSGYNKGSSTIDPLSTSGINGNYKPTSLDTNLNTYDNQGQNIGQHQKAECANGGLCIGHPSNNPFEVFGTSTTGKTNGYNSNNQGQNIGQHQKAECANGGLCIGHPSNNPFEVFGTSTTVKTDEYNTNNNQQHSSTYETTPKSLNNNCGNGNCNSGCFGGNCGGNGNYNSNNGNDESAIVFLDKDEGNSNVEGFAGGFGSGIGGGISGGYGGGYGGGSGGGKSGSDIISALLKEVSSGGSKGGYNTDLSAPYVADLARNGAESHASALNYAGTSGSNGFASASASASAHASVTH